MSTRQPGSYLDYPRKLRYLKLNSALVRRLLSLIYKPGKDYRILFGPLRGLRVRCYADSQFHVMLGLYDLEILCLLTKVLNTLGRLKPTMTACDFGANVGMYTLWLSRLANPGTVYSFEPNPETYLKLRTNLELNQLANVQALPLACSDKTGTATFFLSDAHHEESTLNIGRDAKRIVNNSTSVQVQTTSLDDFFLGEFKRGSPEFIKMDIEGAGVVALDGAKRVIQQQRPVIYIESHNPAEDSAISRTCLEHGFSAYRFNNLSWVNSLQTVYPDPQGVWGNLLLVPTEERRHLLGVLP